MFGFCTSSDVPVMAAIVPDAPGNERVAPAVPVPLPDGEVVEEVEDAAEAPPQAARATAAIPNTAKPSVRRERTETGRRGRSVPPAVRDDGLFSMVMVFP